MADSQAWEEGWQIGTEGAQRRIQRRDARADEEHARQVNDLFDQRDSILKNPTMRDTNGQLVSDAQIKLKDIAAQLRESVHPDIHPGALQKFGDLIVRRMNPAKYQQKADSKNASNDVSDVKTARGWVSEAPVSPEQQAAIEARSQAVGQKIKDDAREKQLNDWFDRNAVDKSPEARQRFLESAMPGFAARAKLGPLQTYKNSKTGAEFLARDDGYGNLVGPTNELIPDEMWQGAVLIGKEGPAKKPIRAWTKDKTGKVFSILLDPTTNKAMPGSENYDIAPPAYLIDKLSTGVYHWTDQDNALHETPESHETRPMWGNGANQTQPPSSSGATNNGQPPPVPSKSQRVQQTKDRILGYKGSAALNKANTELFEDNRMVAVGENILKRAQETPDQMSEADTNFVLMLIRSEAGRVNQTEIAQMFNAGGVAELPDRWAAKTEHGQLPPELRQQLVDFVRDDRDGTATALAVLRQHPDSGQQTPGTDQGGFDWNNPTHFAPVAPPAGPK